MDRGRSYRLGRGFAYRRERFGGILFHYEGVRPDPRVYFVPSPFLVDLLEAVERHPDAPLGSLIDAVAAHFGLDHAQVRSVEAFFTTLTERGALVPL